MNLLHAEDVDQKQWEKELQRVNRALRVVSTTNKALCRISDVLVWLDLVCRTAVDVGGYRMAWVGFAEDDKKKSVRPVACAGFEEDYLKSVGITWDDVPRGRGPVGTAIRTGEPSIIRNILEDPTFDPWRKEALERGYQSCIALPLRSDDRTFGSLNMYASELDAFDSKEVEILKELAEDLAFGLKVVLRTRVQRRNAIEALKQSQQKLEEAQRIAHVGHWERDLGTNKITMSDEIYRIFGLVPQRNNFYLSDLMGIIHPEDRMRVARAVSEAERGLRQFGEEYRIIHPDGEVRVVQSQADVTKDENGKPLRIFGTLQDITERKRALEALGESEQRFRQVAESIEEVFWLTDVGRTETFYISPAYERIWGRSRESLNQSARAWMDAIHPEDRERVKEAVFRFRGSGRYEQEYRILRPDGEQRWIHDTGFPVKDDDGKIHRLAGVAEDITERKSLEEQFLRVQRMESIGTLAGGIAHDLNNMLSPILMTCELLKEEVKDEENRQMVEMIEGNARRGSELVRQVLSFARGVEGRYVTMQPKHLIREIATIVNETFPKNIRIESEVPPGLWLISGDPTQLHQVFLNLSLNARDAMPAGGELKISAENVTIDAASVPMNPQARPGSYVLIKIADTGLGINPEIRDKIFDPFFTTKEVGKGTGLGLSTTLGIVRSHGGFINVISEPGRGSTFEIWLPAKQEKRPIVSVPDETRMPRGRGELILVVDDEASMRIITKQTLEAYGYNVLIAADGTEAVATFAERKDEIRAVITDVMMPGMDGPVLISILARINPDVQIIANSGLSTPELQEKATAAGAKHFLAKPFTAEALLNTLDGVLHAE